MSTLFTKIIQGEIPCHKILEDDEYLAFLDIRPINPGHTLVIPKKEVDYIFDLEDKVLSGLMIFAKRAAKMIKQNVDCARVGIIVAGLEVPHVHVHLIPVFSLADFNFAHAQAASNEELSEVARRICS